MRQAVETALPVISSNGHTLAVELPDEAVLVDADPGRLSQAVSNMLINAAKYTPPGGRIGLDLSVSDGEVRLSVVDTGVGIEPEMLDRIFGMFEQVASARALSQGGLGIGLALVRQIVAAHGGSVAVQSAGAGQGSTFVIRLPLEA